MGKKMNPLWMADKGLVELRSVQIATHQLDLKSFFSFSSRNSATDSNSGPSTHESGNVAQSEEQEVLHPLETVQEIVQAAENDLEGIRVFNQDVHVASDPGLRVEIEQFHPDIRDNVRRAYLVKGPTKPFCHNFPQNPTNKRMFVENWLATNDWLEYSIEKDAAYRFYCFLFKQQPLENHFGHDAFTKDGYRNWKNAYQGLPQHIGGPEKIKRTFQSMKDRKMSFSYQKRPRSP